MSLFEVAAYVSLLLSSAVPFSFAIASSSNGSIQPVGQGVAQPEKEGEGGDCKQFRFHGVFS
jgi:hypothetical protein